MPDGDLRLRGSALKVDTSVIGSAKEAIFDVKAGWCEGGPRNGGLELEDKSHKAECQDRLSDAKLGAKLKVF